MYRTGPDRGRHGLPLMNARTRRLSPLVALAALVCAGCPGTENTHADAGADAAPCDLSVSLGVGGRGSDFVPLHDGDVGEVIVGYQGFIFIQTILRIEGVTDGQVLAPFMVELEGHEPYADNKRVEMIDGGDGAGYSAPLSLYFNDFPLPDVVGSQCRLSVTVTRQGCSGGVGVDLILRDEDPCIHTVDDPSHTGCGSSDAGVPLGDDAGVVTDAGVDAGGL